MGDLTKNFSTSEFRCKCCGGVVVNQQLVAMLQRMRDQLGRPMVITSGYRCLRHNALVGGVSDSYHMQGMAADVVYQGGLELLTLVQAAISAGFKRIGIYSIGIYRRGFVHLDVGNMPSPAMWVE